MDVRVQLTPLAAAKQPMKQEILTGLPQGSVKNLLEVLSTRHPELAPVFDEAKMTRDLRIYVNNDEVPTAEAPRYILRDGDTVSLFIPKGGASK